MDRSASQVCRWTSARPTAVERGSALPPSGRPVACWSMALIRCTGSPRRDADISDLGDFQIALGDIPASLNSLSNKPQVSNIWSRSAESTGLPCRCSGLCQKSTGPWRSCILTLTWIRGRKTLDRSMPTVRSSITRSRNSLSIPKRMIQIGIRSPVEREVHDWTLGKGVTILSAQDVHEMGCAAVDTADTPRPSARGRVTCHSTSTRLILLSRRARERLRWEAWRRGRHKQSCAVLWIAFCRHGFRGGRPRL